MGTRLEFKQALDRMDVPELAREAQRLAREIEGSENASEMQIEELELVQRAMSVRRAPTAGQRAEQREMALTADGCLDVGLTGDGPTDDEECLLGAMRALGVLPGEAIRLLSGGAGPRGPRDGDQGQEDGEQEQEQEQEQGQEGDQEQAEDDDDQEGDDQGQEQEPEPPRPRRRMPVKKGMVDKSELPIIRQSLTFNVPWDPELVTIECMILANWPWNDPEAETLEPTPEARDKLESEGWHNFSAFNHECFVRVIV